MKGRNEPCWCGSGQKFKKCHLDRAEQPRLPRQEALKASKAARDERVCLHPDAAPTTCTKVIVNAHSVQRSGSGLASIARKGHVYGYKSGFSQLDKTAGRFEPALIGINDASTFTGFCSVHDSDTFAPLERQEFPATDEQLALLGYRAICRELMAKRGALRLNPTLREGDRGLGVGSQRAWQDKMLGHEIGMALGLTDLEHAKRQFEETLRTREFSRVRKLLIEFDSSPAVLACAALTPEFDFDGRKLQDLNDLATTMDMVTFSLVGTSSGKGASVFSWIDDSHVASQFVASVDAIAPDDLPHRLVQFSFESFENIYWSPEWWESLSDTARKALIMRMNSQIWSDRRADCYRDDGTRAATWRVTSISR
jgi:hypothetical protein